MAEHWQAQRERGSGLGVAILFALARVLGRRPARLVLVFVTLYFLLTGAAARRASRDYLRRVLCRAATWRDLWAHFWCFAGVALDRVLLLAGSRELDITLDHSAEVFATARRGGALLIVSHFGSFEAMRAPGTRIENLPLSIVMDRAHGARFNAVMERAAPDFAAQVIDAGEAGPALVLKLREALGAGRLVGLMADRARAGEATTTVDFLGSPAQLPLGPWQLALALRCPVILGFAAYCGDGRYAARFELFTAGVTAPRGARGAAAAEAAQAYARRLEEQVRSAPYNWFNFYDFWQP